MDLNTARNRASGSGDLVWHYTSLDVLRLIVEGNTLLATEVAFQNDIRETETADRAVGSILEGLAATPQAGAFAQTALRVLRDIDDGVPIGGRIGRRLLDSARFILCASSHHDSLYAWRTYGGSSIGCAIGLDHSVPLGVVTPKTGTSLSAEGWLPVDYDPITYTDRVQLQLWDLAMRWNEAQRSGSEWATLELEWDELPQVRAAVRARAKDSAFADEHEHRATFSNGITPEMILTTPSAMGPRPHIRLAAAKQWGARVENPLEAPRLPIRAVRLGPGAPESAATSLQWLLIANGYELDPLPLSPELGVGDDWSAVVMTSRSSRPYRAT